MLQTDTSLTPAALRLYALLYDLGADHTPVSIPVAELANRLGYTPRHTRRALLYLFPRYLQVQRKGPRSTPCIVLRLHHRVA